MPENIQIYIDRVVLEGYDHLNKVDLYSAIQEHLLSMIAENGLPKALLNNNYHGRLNGGQVNSGTNPKPEQVGNDIANGVYHGISSAE